MWSSTSLASSTLKSNTRISPFKQQHQSQWDYRTPFTSPRQNPTGKLIANRNHEGKTVTRHIVGPTSHPYRSAPPPVIQPHSSTGQPPRTQVTRIEAAPPLGGLGPLMTLFRLLSLLSQSPLVGRPPSKAGTAKRSLHPATSRDWCCGDMWICGEWRGGLEIRILRAGLRRLICPHSERVLVLSFMTPIHSIIYED